MIHPVKFLLISILILAAIAGCGSDDESSDGGSASAGETSSLTKAQFIKRANAICGRHSENFLTAIYAYIEREGADSNKSEAELTAAAVKKVLVPQFQAQVNGISGLSAPAGDEAQIEAFLAAMQQGVDSLESQSQLSLATDVDAALRPAGKLAHAYGIQSCL